MVDLFIAAEKISKIDSPKSSDSEKKSGLLDHPHLLYAFWENPTNITFEDQEKNEKLLLLLRRHFNSNLHWIFLSIILFLIPPLFIPFSSHLDIFSFLNLPTRFLIIFLMFYYLVIFTYAFVNFITWYFNVSLITDQRIIDVNFSDLVYKNVAETKLSLLQDTSYVQVGVLRSIFDYGDVFVQTAGTQDNFSFPAVPKPERVVRIIENLIGRNGGPYDR